MIVKTKVITNSRYFSVFKNSGIRIYKFKSTGTIMVAKKLIVYIKSIFLGLLCSEKMNSNIVKEQNHSTLLNKSVWCLFA